MLNILYDIFVTPIVYLFDVVFHVFYVDTNSAGVSIVGLSLAVNLLCLPLFLMADRAQAAERARQADMEHWVTHIKRTFKGDERQMMLSTYYAQKHYSPLYALAGALPLLLQIPFFMAAYNYLSALPMLRGASWAFIPDLGAPDGLIRLGGMAINALPIAMTLINAASTAVYTRGLPLREKVQAYGLALVFLVLLYDSPAGLVFYWTCNQVFSLVKSAVAKLGERSERLGAIAAAFSSAAAGAWLVNCGTPLGWWLVAGGVCILIAKRRALISNLAAKPGGPRRSLWPDKPERPVSYTTQFLLATGLLALLFGLLVPSAVIAASPTEFLSPWDASAPGGYLVHTVCVCLGFFVLWPSVYYFLAAPSHRRVFALVATLLAVAAVVSYFFFGKELGLISPELVFDGNIRYPAYEIFVNNIAMTLVVIVSVLVWFKLNRAVPSVLAIVAVAVCIMGVSNVFASNAALADARAGGAQESELFESDGTPKKLLHLSKTGRNVIVLFEDRAVAGLLPRIFMEAPELQEKFDGFTFYPNTLSYGGHTIFGSPALFGGYEYTPTAINERDDEAMVDKHNEALKLMPQLFSQNGYHASVVNPPFANYQWIPDVSIYDGMQDVEAYSLREAYNGIVRERHNVRQTKDMYRTFVFYSLLRGLPEAWQQGWHDNGNYLSAQPTPELHESFLTEYADLEMLPEITDADSDEQGFVLFGNAAPHEPNLLQMPDYEIAAHVDNSAYGNPTQVHIPGQLSMSNDWYTEQHYHVNAATYRKIADWFDYLRAEGVYDNSRIIIVADHGSTQHLFPALEFYPDLYAGRFTPLLMVKDFDAHGFTTDETFMTNADTPTLALQGIVDNPVNPYTGKPINSDEKTAHDQIVTTSVNWETRNQAPTQFIVNAPWYAVHDNVYYAHNWRKVEVEQ